MNIPGKTSKDRVPEDLKPTRQQVLIDNYREIRAEGLGYVRSLFDDIKLLGGLIAVIVSGEWLTGEPRLLLILPYSLVIFLIYAVQKFRINNTITSYMIYLEGVINTEYQAPIMLWNRQLIGKTISAGRESRAGDFLYYLFLLIALGIFGGLCFWVVSVNISFLTTDPWWMWLYLVPAGILFILTMGMLFNAMFVIKKLTPENISALAREIESELGILEDE